uniref:Small ribosomal subunit protein mS29 n=1 Tax=Panagrellus redivivus TaxID=6233 RepID=A0A7E4USI4_PANRE
MALLPKSSVKTLFSATKTLTAIRPYNKAASDDPSQLARADLGKLYHIPVDAAKNLNFNKILPSKYAKQLNTLDECAILCRPQFLEVLHCFQAVRPTFPGIRVVLWGRFGTGKTLTLAQAVHYAYTQNWVILNVRDVMDWTRVVKDVQMSTYRTGRIDLPEHSVNFLNHFKQQNQHLWKTILTDLKTTKDYVWTKTEKTPIDKPLTDIVDMGLASPFLANDCVGALCRELRLHASSGALKLLVAMDAGNSLYGRTVIRKADRTFATTDELSLVQQFRKFFRDDWTNGLVLTIADKREISDAHIDPFIPIETQLYTEAEAKALHDYYKDKQWLVTDEARSEAGLKQLYYLAAFNPHHFERLCAFN